MPNFKVFKGVIYASDLKPTHYIIYGAHRLNETLSITTDATQFITHSE